MSVLDLLLPTPRLRELDFVDVAGPPARAWQIVRHLDLGRSSLLRALVSRCPSDAAKPRSSLRLDDLTAPTETPGFRVLHDEAPRVLVVGAIGRIWEREQPFIDVADACAFSAFAGPGFAKVAWAVRVAKRGDDGARVEIELRVDTTDDDAWRRFRRYFRAIGIGARLVRHAILAMLERELAPRARRRERLLDGDELLHDATIQETRALTIAARPRAIWHWLVQMGRDRGGFYGIDLIDNGGRPSARELPPESSQLCVGDRIAATDDDDRGIEVLRVAPDRCLVLGGLYNPDREQQLPFAATRPARFWQVTWAFVLEPLDPGTTRLHVRARAAFAPREELHLDWVRPSHRLIEAAQLRQLAARAEGRLTDDDWREVLAGDGGAAIMTAALFTPFLRSARSHWGIDAEVAARALPGDKLVPEPRWSWTHGVEIAASAERVWPWIAQIGADHGGFYNYQWLENVAGSRMRNVERVHPEWQVQKGDDLRLHPTIPPLRVVDVAPGRCFVAHGAPDLRARAAGKPWAAVSWLFFVEPLGPARCRLISRYRCATSDGLATRLSFGPSLVEPIGFAMDRRMLLCIKDRVQGAPQPMAVVSSRSPGG